MFPRFKFANGVNYRDIFKVTKEGWTFILRPFFGFSILNSRRHVNLVNRDIAEWRNQLYPISSSRHQPPPLKRKQCFGGKPEAEKPSNFGDIRKKESSKRTIAGRWMTEGNGLVEWFLGGCESTALGWNKWENPLHNFRLLMDLEVSPLYVYLWRGTY